MDGTRFSAMRSDFQKLSNLASERGAQRLANQTKLADSLERLQTAQGGLYGAQTNETNILARPRAAAFMAQAEQGRAAAGLGRAQENRINALLGGELEAQANTNAGARREYSLEDLGQILRSFGNVAGDLTSRFDANFGARGMQPLNYSIDFTTGEPILR